MFATSFVFAPLKWFMRSFVLPKPGGGPDRETMENGFLNLVAYATGSKGTKAKVELYFPKDPGYMDTGRMVAEAGLALGLEESSLEQKGGYLSPACLGKTYLRRQNRSAALSLSLACAGWHTLHLVSCSDALTNPE